MITTYDYLRARGWQERKQTSTWIQGLCPIHTEHNPSFYVYTDDQHWKCYGCQRDGDLARMVLLSEFSHYPEQPSTEQWRHVFLRIKELGGAAAASFLSSSSSSPHKRRESPPITREQQAILAIAHEWWQMQLYHHRGRDARVWLASKGISQVPYINAIGFIPSMKDISVFHAFDNFMKHETKCHLGTSDWRTHGISTGILRADGCPRMQNRVVFVSHSPQGKPMYYQGRTLMSDEEMTDYQKRTGRSIAKYLGMPLVRKYPFFLSMDGDDPLLPGTIITEGPKEPIVLAQDGLFGIATLGPGFQPWMFSLCRQGEPIYIMTHSDTPRRDTNTGKIIYPGDEQAQEIMKVCAQEGWPAYRIIIPAEHKDVDTWRRMCGIQPILTAIQEASQTDSAAVTPVRRV